MSVDGGYGHDSGAGWSGSDTSRERAEREDSTGVTQKRQQQILDAVEGWKEHGMTCGEVETTYHLGHGAASAALTRLHRSGHLIRLKERRRGARAEIYVAPQYVNGREQSPYRPNRVHRHPDEMSREAILDLMDRADVSRAVPISVSTVRRLLKEAWK